MSAGNSPLVGFVVSGPLDVTRTEEVPRLQVGVRVGNYGPELSWRCQQLKINLAAMKPDDRADLGRVFSSFMDMVWDLPRKPFGMAQAYSMVDSDYIRLRGRYPEIIQLFVAPGMLRYQYPKTMN